MVELILIEITAVPAERSRGRHNPRVVKRKMSRFPTKSRAAPAPRHRFRYDAPIRIVAPPGPPPPNIPPSATPRIDMAPTEKPRRRSRHIRAPANRCPAWLEHVRAWRRSGLPRATYGEHHRLNPRPFHHWVARARPSRHPKAPIRPDAP
jgi:hypothetical protein